MSNLINPFKYTTPEDLNAEEIISIFVDVFTDLYKVVDPGHLFLMGPRGIGKSMLLRYLEPDCQCLAPPRCKFDELKFVGIHIPIKKTDFNKSELLRFENTHADIILNEHFMVTHICIVLFSKILKLYDNVIGDIIAVEELYDFLFETFIPSLEMGNFKVNSSFLGKVETVHDILNTCKIILDDIYKEFKYYYNQLSFSKELPPYNGPLLSYIDFLLPIFTSLFSVHGFPKVPLYLLIDDAHFFTLTQTKILNSWVATRTSLKISLKISTQYDYKSFCTNSGASIDTPHDYSRIDMATIYTGSNKSKYWDRINKIIKKRFEVYGINKTPEEFFPEDEEQERKIKEIEKYYLERFDEGKGKGYYRNDDAIRYSRPDYIKSLAGKDKNSHTYSYAGFNQLVHLSSGCVRYFLDSAYAMFAEELSSPKSDTSEIAITEISPSIQNSVVRKDAEEFLFSEMEDIKDEVPQDNIDKLSNLIQGLGGTFRQILLSERSERRVFSIAISDQPSDKVKAILKLGAQRGYFHQSTIGRKDSGSGGRTRLYVMNRRLAPIWTLDPTSFAGYLFVKNHFLESLINSPFVTLRSITRFDSSKKVDDSQLTFFDESEAPLFDLLSEVSDID